MDNPEKVKSIRRVSRVWLEEATEFHKRDFEQLDLRLR
jgi:phage terminase large subunit